MQHYQVQAEVFLLALLLGHIRAADLSTKSYLETEAEVDDYLAKLKAELLAAIRAGQRARIQ